jgi:cytochrome c551/c552
LARFLSKAAPANSIGVTYNISGDFCKMATCVSCHQPLVLVVEPDEYEDVEMGGTSSGKAPAPEPKTVPDDVQLNCGCHFHW